jgi:hypothetical protein
MEPDYLQRFQTRESDAKQEVSPKPTSIDLRLPPSQATRLSIPQPQMPGCYLDEEQEKSGNTV